MSDPKSIILLFLEPNMVTVVFDAMFYNNEPKWVLLCPGLPVLKATDLRDTRGIGHSSYGATAIVAYKTLHVVFPNTSVPWWSSGCVAQYGWKGTWVFSMIDTVGRGLTLRRAPHYTLKRLSVIVSQVTAVQSYH